MNHYRGLIERVIDQTDRRIFRGEKVPAQDKLFSLFEAHTDIIVKGSRDIQYGHKLNLMTGPSRLVLDVVIEDGNPADTERFIPMLDDTLNTMGKHPGKWLQMVVMPAQLTWPKPKKKASRPMSLS